MLTNQQIMITPENNIPLDDSQASEAGDQQSQKDIHSNGLEEANQPTTDDQADPTMLKQAYDAATPSFTLNLDENDPKEND